MFVIAVVALRILREFDWCQGRDGMKNPNELPHFIVTWSIFLLCWGTAVFWFVDLGRKFGRLKSIVTLIAATVLLIPFWGFFVGDVDHNRAIFFSN